MSSWLTAFGQAELKHVRQHSSMLTTSIQHHIMVCIMSCPGCGCCWQKTRELCVAVQCGSGQQTSPIDQSCLPLACSTIALVQTPGVGLVPEVSSICPQWCIWLLWKLWSLSPSPKASSSSVTPLASPRSVSLTNRLCSLVQSVQAGPPRCYFWQPWPGRVDNLLRAIAALLATCSTLLTQMQDNVCWTPTILVCLVCHMKWGLQGCQYDVLVGSALGLLATGPKMSLSNSGGWTWEMLQGNVHSRCRKWESLVYCVVHFFPVLVVCVLWAWARPHIQRCRPTCVNEKQAARWLLCSWPAMNVSAVHTLSGMGGWSADAACLEQIRDWCGAAVANSHFKNTFQYCTWTGLPFSAFRKFYPWVMAVGMMLMLIRLSMTS